ncbi:hypothetical protein D2Q93_09665 [Alicyclobacillaceae bacterium I2511]|nr:hypothetical protein D2Q93_09665 [Alicyclobacillaceae bacterium I2511]
MDNARYLHPLLIAIFMGLFTILSIVSFLNMFKQRQIFTSLILLLSILIFGYSTYIIATS